VASAVAFAAAALVVSPLASLGYIALTGHSEIWPHLVAYVLPAAAVDTALLLVGVATIAAVAAWARRGSSPNTNFRCASRSLAASAAAGD
jgi:hypothetical protein